MSEKINPNCYPNQKLRGLKRKYEYVQMRGGKCEKCGYDKNLSALDFHHLNPEEKEFQVDMRAFSNHSLDKLEKELSKCVLLCANCHRETHYSDLEMDLIPDKIKEMIENNQDKKSFSNNKPKEESICPTCGKSFPKVKGKIYCSKECREKAKNYPSIEEVLEQYEILKSWEKVGNHFNLSRRVIQGIRKRNGYL